MSNTLKIPGRGKLRRAVLATAGAACLLLGGGLSAQASNWPGPLPANPYGDPVGANYQRIEILTTSDGGAINDGTFVFGNANPTYPSTGTGVFQPFKRVQRSTGACGSSGAGDCLTFEDPANPGTYVEAKSQNGFNTDAAQSAPINFDTKEGIWTHSVTMSDFNLTGTGGYIELALDANQIGCSTCLANRLVITDLQVFIGPNLDNPEATGGGPENNGYTGAAFNPTDNGLLGQGPAWQLDSSVNGNVDILLQAGICSRPGQCGSGHGDMSIFIPVANLGSFGDTDNFVLYSEYLYVNDGFEEWNFRNAQIAQVSEPGVMALFGLGVIGMGYVRRRRRIE